jgi:hypothetical protein
MPLRSSVRPLVPTSHCLGNTTWCNPSRVSLRESGRETERGGLEIIEKPLIFRSRYCAGAELCLIITAISPPLSLSLPKLVGLLLPHVVRLSRSALLPHIRTSKAANRVQKLLNRFETLWGELIFPVYLMLPAALDLGFTQTLTEMNTTSREVLFLGSRAPIGRGFINPIGVWRQRLSQSTETNWVDSSRTESSIRKVVFLIKGRTTDNIQNCETCVLLCFKVSIRWGFTFIKKEMWSNFKMFFPLSNRCLNMCLITFSSRQTSLMLQIYHITIPRHYII